MRYIQKILFPAICVISISPVCANSIVIIPPGFSGIGSFNLTLDEITNTLTGEDFTFYAYEDSPFRVKAKVSGGDSSGVLTFTDAGSSYQIPYTLQCGNLNNDSGNPVNYTFYYGNNTTAGYSVELTDSYKVLYTTKNQCDTGQGYSAICKSTQITTTDNVNY